MNICSDKDATSRQIIKHIKKIETPMHDVRELMIDIVTQYQKMDKLAYALGVFDTRASFIDSLSWCSIVGKMDHHKQSLGKSGRDQLAGLLNYLDELTDSFSEAVISKIQHYRDRWMRQVLFVNFITLAVVASIFVAGLYATGIGLDKALFIESIQQRPFFYILFSIALLLSLFIFHFIIRRIILRSLLDKLDDKLPKGMSLSKALTNNARARHSIFRPNPVGWNYYQEKIMVSILDDLTLLREKLGTVLAGYSENEST